jgi:hypothetical protein
MSLKRMESSTRENPMMVFNKHKKAGGDFMTVESFRKLASERMEVPLVPGVDRRGQNCLFRCAAKLRRQRCSFPRYIWER